MSTVLTNGIIIPDNGSRNWGGDLANNWNIIDLNVGYMNDVKNKVTTLENSVTTLENSTAENTSNIQINTSNISALQTSKQDVIEDLETIRSGATAGATAVQPSELTSKANDSDVVHKSGNETINGNKVFSNTIYRYADVTTIGEAIVYKFDDTNANSCGYIYNKMRWHNNSVYNKVGSYNAKSGKRFALDLITTDTGRGVAYLSGDVPTFGNLTASTNSIKESALATMGWVNNPVASANVVHRSGNETINGTKTFTSQIVGSIDRAEKDLNGNIITSTYATKSELNQIILAKNLTSTNIAPAGVVDCGDGNGKLQQLYITANGTFMTALPFPVGLWKSTSFTTISPNDSTIFIKIG